MSDSEGAMSGEDYYEEDEYAEEEEEDDMDEYTAEDEIEEEDDSIQEDIPFHEGAACFFKSGGGVRSCIASLRQRWFVVVLWLNSMMVHPRASLCVQTRVWPGRSGESCTASTTAA